MERLTTRAFCLGFFTVCNGEGNGTDDPSTNNIPKYTTTITGKVITPAKAADPTKGSVITTARVWASIDSTKKVDVGTDGSYTLEVAGHSGSFTITAEYTQTGNKNYKASNPQPVTTTAEAHTQDIALNYGYTITLSGRVFDNPPGASTPIRKNGATVIITVENRGLEVARTTSSTIGGNVGSYRVRFDHPGIFRIEASFDGRSDITENASVITIPTRTYNPVLY